MRCNFILERDRNAPLPTILNTGGRSMKNRDVDTGMRSSNQSVSKILQLLSFLADSRSPLRLVEIAEGVGMPQATVLRYLNAFIEEGFAYQEDLSGRYALTWKVQEIGDQVKNRLSLRTLSGDIINGLYESLALGICLVTEQNMQCMYLDCLYEPSLREASLLWIGKRAPLHATGSGKLLLSRHTEGEIEAFIQSEGLPALTGKTITKREDLLKELEQVRRQGYAIDDEECEPGLRCVSAPVYGYTGTVIAAVSAFGPAERLTSDYIQHSVLPVLRRGVDQISFRAGGEVRS